jgi:hypothetical protein
MHKLRNGVLATSASILLFGGMALAQMNAPASGNTKSATTGVPSADGAVLSNVLLDSE